MKHPGANYLLYHVIYLALRHVSEQGTFLKCPFLRILSSRHFISGALHSTQNTFVDFATFCLDYRDTIQRTSEDTRPYIVFDKVSSFLSRHLHVNMFRKFQLSTLFAMTATRFICGWRRGETPLKCHLHRLHSI